jgi:uncharacterized protein
VSKELSSTFAIGTGETLGNGPTSSLLMFDPTTVELEPETIPSEWVLSGSPAPRGRVLARSKDWTESVVVWECAASSFRWHYARDETIFVISGAAFLLKENGEERRFGPGEVGFFPAGTTCTWRVDDHIRKVAVLRETMWSPFGLALKVWKKLLRIAGLSGKSPL